MDPSAFPTVATVIGFTPDSDSGPLVATLACPIPAEEVETSVVGQDSSEAKTDSAIIPFETDDPVTKALVDNIVGNLPTKKQVVKLRCDICNIEVNGKAVLEAHLAGTKHFKKMKLIESIAKSQEPTEKCEPPAPNPLLCFRCEVCNVSVNSIQQLQIHSQGTKHKNNVENLTQKKDKLLEKQPVCCPPVFAGSKHKNKLANFSQRNIDRNIDLSSAYQLQQYETPRKQTENIPSNTNNQLALYSRRNTSHPDNLDAPRIHVQKISSNVSSSYNNNNNRFEPYSKGRTFHPRDQVIAKNSAADVQFSCSACNLILNSAIQLMQHESSKKHADMVSGFEPSSNTNNQIEIPNGAAPIQYSCSTCNLVLNSAIQLNAHLTSKKHADRVSGNVSSNRKNIHRTKPYSRNKALPLNSHVTGPVGTKSNEGGQQSLKCDVCNVYTNSVVQLEQHYYSRKHIDKLEGTKGFMDTSNTLPPQIYITKKSFGYANRFGGPRMFNSASMDNNEYKKPELVPPQQPILDRMLNNLNSNSGGQQAENLDRFHIKKQLVKEQVSFEFLNYPRE